MTDDQGEFGRLLASLHSFLFSVCFSNHLCPSHSLAHLGCRVTVTRRLPAAEIRQNKKQRGAVAAVLSLLSQHKQLNESQQKSTDGLPNVAAGT